MMMACIIIMYMQDKYLLQMLYIALRTNFYKWV
jgi:hypothetical protein